MKYRYIVLLCVLLLAYSACQKNTMSKIPSISFISLTPDTITVNVDTPYLEFHLTDGNADLGNDPNSTTVPIKYDIYIKDFRYDTGYVGYFFPTIDQSIENPKKGIEGICYFGFYGVAILTPRTDSLHTATGDTTHFEVYIMDRAGDTSNHIITPSLIIRP